MKNYETPNLYIEEITVSDNIASTFTEGDSDNKTGWLDKWTSGILGGNA